MEQLNRITVVVEPRETGQPALERAVLLARRSGAKLELYCMDIIGGAASQDIRDAHSRDLASWMDQLRERLSAEGLDVTAVTSYGRPHWRYLLDHVADMRPDVLVKATRFHGRMERTYFTASDWRLVTHSPVPLVLVKAAGMPEGGPVLAAVDPFHDDDKPAELDHRILELARALARLCDRPMTVVHAVSPITPLPIAGEAYLSRIRSETADLNRHIEAVRALVQEYGVAARDVQVVAGHADGVIAGAARERRASMVVMGAVSRSSVKELFIGNTAERVLEEIESDLVVVPMAPVGPGPERARPNDELET